MKSNLIIRARVKPDVELDELKNFGFNWAKYDQEKGVHWTKGDITIYSADRKITYKKLTQEVLNDILWLCASGKLIISKGG